MKKLYTIILISSAFVSLHATSYTISISGFAYSPASLTVTIGDVVTISSTGNHPLAEVSQTTWVANGTATLSSGFGNKTANYIFTVSGASSIYYVCTNHVGSGMKGKIDVASTVSIYKSNPVFELVSLFPNPTKNKFSIKLNTFESTNLTVKLFSICGQEIESFTSTKEIALGLNSISFDLQNTVSTGIYFIELTAGSKKVVKKLIVE